MIALAREARASLLVRVMFPMKERGLLQMKPKRRQAMIGGADARAEQARSDPPLAENARRRRSFLIPEEHGLSNFVRGGLGRDLEITFTNLVLNRDGFHCERSSRGPRRRPRPGLSKGLIGCFAKHVSPPLHGSGWAYMRGLPPWRRQASKRAPASSLQLSIRIR